jgi:hypothetical protein
MYLGPGGVVYIVESTLAATDKIGVLGLWEMEDVSLHIKWAFGLFYGHLI